ncbi:hypothetical protein PQR14_20225 [Paraburkholderia bryophila]|uniref:hypothetical protein n=1 Tax=Burkholderiaceae TaxID=119060 RepID=UPI000550EDD4|nr:MULTISPECIES: hypothetical protein [Burkholderiaceae]
MKNRAKILLIFLASVVSLIGLLFVIGTIVDIKSIDQVRRLLSFKYLSFVDSLEAGGISGMTSDFFTGVGLLLLGSTLFTRVDKVSRAAHAIAGVVFIFFAACLVYACLTANTGARPF